MSVPLEDWLDEACGAAVPHMLRSISATDLVKHRPGFGQTMVPRPGSVVASPVPASYDPDPDYIFHWHRDAAIVMDALRVAAGEGADRHLADYVAFNQVLEALDGRRLVEAPAWRDVVAPAYRQFLRTDAELAAALPGTARDETRVNPDGTLDISRWPRPQTDGPALRALTLLRWLGGRPALDAGIAEQAALVRADLAYTRQRWRLPSFDLWEEAEEQHYYTRRVQAAALTAGAAWLGALGQADEAAACREDAGLILASLDGHWLEAEGVYSAGLARSDRLTPKALDIAVILAANHAGGSDAAHSAADPRVHATLDRLAAEFAALYPINRGRQAAPAMGRYPGDVYYGGNPWYVATLAAAEFCFRAAALGVEPAASMARGDAWLETVRAVTPADHALSEQFDRASGAQVSAKHLAWSYAALITCASARRAVLKAPSASRVARPSPA